jgi:aspartate dehydrogenase
MRIAGATRFPRAMALGAAGDPQLAFEAGRITAVEGRAMAPAAWRGSPAEQVADLGSLTQRTVLYRGNAGEAALRFPQNANVAAALALAGLGFDATEVELVADPDAPGNVHEIEAEGAAGRFAIQLQGKPSRSNPKTSALAAMSVARALLNENATIVI